MLKLKQINKEYKTGELVQHALNNVSLNLRDNEFVAILGPSGSGKTTLLNIIGGLDRYDSGDLVINGISTKKYTDRDWDSYRNHTIGFVFQSYNLIPHQTVLGNVELALSISGVSKAERRRRAAAALEQVGLGNQLHMHPGEMSGGQMQRVAFARALVNNPDILLADEPTGALDSETSIQVMELLKEVARDRLVVMVTHHPELAARYAPRIVKLTDGVVRSDTMPYEPEDEAAAVAPVHRNMGHSSMSLLTSLSLSFNNLLTKKARTLLTAFAGSIGIIGIALILSLSNGVSRYISNMEKSTLAAYPLQISSTGVDLASMMDPDTYTRVSSGSSSAPEGMVTVRQLLSQLNIGAASNDLRSLKAYLDSDACSIRDNATVEYTYNASPLIYRQDADGTVHKLNPDTTFTDLAGQNTSVSSLLTSVSSPHVFGELAAPPALYEDQYDVKAGRWPEKCNELVLVLSANGSISDYALYAMGMRDQAELDKILQQYASNQLVDLPDDYGTYNYEEFLGKTFRLVNKADCYTYDAEHKLWLNKQADADYMQQVVADSEELTVVGVVQPKADATSAILYTGLDYLHETYPQFADIPVVKTSNFIGDTLDMAAAAHFEQVLLVGHIGKLCKLAGGIMNTHSHTADCRTELFCTHAALCGADREVCTALYNAATTDACLEILDTAGLREPVLQSLLAAIQLHLDRRAGGAFRVGAVLFSNQHGPLGATDTAAQLLNEWKEH